MERAFVLKSAIPELATNGKISVYPTLDSRVNMIIITHSNFVWENRKETECFRCGKCNCYIFPGDDMEVVDGKTYHRIC